MTHAPDSFSHAHAAPSHEPSVRGGVDLSALAAQAAPASAGAAPAGALEVVEVTEFSFQSFAERSVTVPVFLLLVSRLAPGCAELRVRVERVASRFAGRLVLGVADVDEQPGIAQAFQVNAVPAMLALIGGRPAPLFQGSPEEEQLLSVFEQVLTIAADAGIGTAGELGPEPAPEPLPPLHQEAYDAIERGDLGAAIAAYDQALKENPRDADARAGRAQVAFMQRSAELDPAAAIAAAAAAPGDVSAQFAAADAEFATGEVEAAFTRLVELVRASAGEKRDQARVRLVELFEILGPGDPLVAAARQQLASALN